MEAVMRKYPATVEDETESISAVVILEGAPGTAILDGRGATVIDRCPKAELKLRQAMVVVNRGNVMAGTSRI
jgi:hypothetical protein